jgi:signal transduction histidine kinase
MASVPLAELLRGMVNSYPNLHPPAADITIELEDVVVLGNESLLTQCFGNLLDNAVKFVAPGVHPRVRVWAESVRSAARAMRSDEEQTSLPPAAAGTPAAAFVRVWVEDNGIGVATEAQERIFAMFQRMHHESEYPGTGVGLAIVRKAVERMNGRVGLESEPGHGSKFWLELPQPAEAQNQQRLPEAA